MGGEAPAGGGPARVAGFGDAVPQEPEPAEGGLLSVAGLDRDRRIKRLRKVAARGRRAAQLLELVKEAVQKQK